MAYLLKRPGSSHWYVAWTGLDGKERRQSTHTARRAVAEKIMARIVTETERERILGQPLRPTVPTLAAFWPRYVKHARIHLRPASLLRILVNGKHLLAAFGTVSLAHIAPAAVERYKEERLGSVTTASVNRELSTLRALLTFACRLGILEQHPIRGKVAQLPEPPPRQHILTEAEEFRLRDQLPQWLLDVAVFALQTGLRHGQIRALKWSDIDWRHSVLNVAQSKRTRPRSLPVNSYVLWLLGTIPHGTNSPYVFRMPKSGSQLSSYVWIAWERARRRAGLEGLRIHDLRHTCATRLSQAGTDLQVVRDLLGHSSLRQTERYAHVSRDAMRAAVEKINPSSIRDDAAST